jgi:tRNA(Ile)-lysidine synthetase-like protein
MKSTDDRHETPSDSVRLVAAEAAACGATADSRIVVGCSGGSDSTALLCLLSEAGYTNLVCAHLDHGLRDAKQARAEAGAVKELAGRVGARFESEAIDRGRLAAEARATGASVEEWARRSRYGFLARVCRHSGARFAAVGHTRDDQVETVLMRLLQGSDVEGMSGMRPCTELPEAGGARDATGSEAREEPAAGQPATAQAITLMRPLLGVSREELRGYLARRGVSYIDDPSNTDTRYLRNAVRRDILPVVRRHFPGYAAAVSRSAGKLAEVSDFLGQQLASAEAELWRAETGPDGELQALYADRTTFFELPGALKRRLFYRAFDRLGPTRTRVPARFVESLPAADPEAEHRILGRGHGLLVEVADGWLACRRDVVPRGDHGYLYLVFEGYGAGEAPGSDIELEMRAGTGETDVVRLRGEELSPPLILRERRAGDSVKLSGGTRSLKRVFSDRSIAESARSDVPVLEDKRGIVGLWAGVLGDEYENLWRRGVRRTEEGTTMNGADAVPTDVVRIAIDCSEVV